MNWLSYVVHLLFFIVRNVYLLEVQQRSNMVVIVQWKIDSSVTYDRLATDVVLLNVQPIELS